MIDWELILVTSFNVIGLLEFVKGIWKGMPKAVLPILQIVLSLLLAVSFSYFPGWVRIGISALSVSQVGYEVIIQTVTKKLGGKS